MQKDQYSRLSEDNRKAWDALYGKTQDLVWGAEPVGFLNEFRRDIAGRLRSCAQALDAATGEGRNLSTLIDWGFRVTACDASEHAMQKMPSMLGSSVNRVISDLYTLPFQSGRFDFVLASDIIETLPDPNRALRELWRVLRPGGLLLCNIPGMEDGISSIDMNEIDDNRYLFRDRFFFQFMTEAQATELLVDSGFRPVRTALCSWVEKAHPEFRDTEHEHTSRVFLVERPQ